MKDTLGISIAKEDKLIKETLDSCKQENLKNIINFLKEFNTNDSDNDKIKKDKLVILSQIKKLENNLENSCKILQKQYEALYNIIEYLNNNNIKESKLLEKIMNKINEIESKEKYLKS